MRPVPVVFHLGPLQIHTYGIGLAITFFFAYWYFGRRLRRRGYPTGWLSGVFLWVIVAAVVGARALHVLSNLHYYGQHPGDVLAIWHGGLSSFGGLLFAVPTGVVLTHRRCPELGLGRGLDLVAPVLMAAWSMGRLLGPQLMVNGGGHPTHQWFGMYYAGQVGRRLPVPVFQALEDFAVYLVLILIERRLERWPDGSPRRNYPPGVVLGTGMILWGIERSLDEHLWLGEEGHLGSLLVQVAGVLLVVGGAVLLVSSRRRWSAWLAAGAPGGRVPDEEGRIEEGRLEEAPVGGAPVGGAPVEEAPVGGAPVEEAPVEEAPVEDRGPSVPEPGADELRRSASRPSPPLSGAPPGGR